MKALKFVLKAVGKIFDFLLICCGLAFLIFTVCLIFDNTDNQFTISQIKYLMEIFFCISFCLISPFQLNKYLNGKSAIEEKQAPEFIETAVNINYAKNNEDVRDYNRKISAVHEAGHAVMSNLQSIEYFTINMSPITPNITYIMKSLDADGMKSMILIAYAGAAAEELLLGKIHSGCMETEKSDFSSACNYIKKYIVMKDNTLSKTFLDEEINEQMVLLSKTFYEEAKDILAEHISVVQAVSDRLLQEDVITATDIEKIIKNKE